MTVDAHPIRTGQALTVTAGTDQSLTTVAGQTANQLLPNPYSPTQDIHGWLNPAAFAFQLHERRSIQLRGEAFNLPNTLNPNNPTVARNSAVFGVIQSDINGSAASQGDYRIVPLAAKFVF